MTATAAETSDALALDNEGRWLPHFAKSEKRFRIGLLVAFLLHAMLLVGVQTSEPRRIGNAGGVDDAISIDLVTEADLKSNATVADIGGPPPSPEAPPPVAEQPVTPPPAPPVEETKPAEPVTPLKEAVEPAPPTEQPAEQPVEKAEAKPAEPAPEEPSKLPSLSDFPDSLALPDNGPKTQKTPETSSAQGEAKPPPKPAEKKPEQKQKTASLDLSPPATPRFTAAGPNGSAAGLSRPAGITRSGANDDFARRVVLALQRTMPQLANTLGTVTVKITLNENGNLADVQVIRQSQVAGLDQSVIFATQQTNYPIPPGNSKDVDRIFFVRYIYR